MTVLVAVGDVGPDRDDPRECFVRAESLLKSGDITFCQLECNLTTRGSRMPQARHTHRAPPATAQAMHDAGFNVVSFAGNHCMDWGPQGFNDTIDNLAGAGMNVVGVGADLSEARQPRVVEANGVRVAFLACSSILPEGYWATESRGGCAPLRAHTLYEQVELDQPGTPPRIRTWARREDLDRLLEDIATARAQADVVVLSLHWGIHFIPGTIADYQREVAHAAIDAGVDLLLGHHAHILKGIEVYRGKPVFYSLGNFAMDLRMTPEHAASRGFREVQALSPGWEPNFDSLYNFPPDSRMTIIVRANLGTAGLEQLEVLPAWINDDAQAEPLARGDERYGKVVDYLRWCCDSEGLAAIFDDGPDGVVIGLEAS